MASSLVIGDVDAGTDILEIDDHGFVTGDGPAAIYTPDGTIPGGLAAVTDYWIIRLDDHHIQLAASSADAMSGTEIDLTDAGTGALYLQLGAPYRRPRTYVNGSQLPSRDLNDNFDAWKALYALLTGQTQGLWPEVRLAVPLGRAPGWLYFDPIGRPAADINLTHDDINGTVAANPGPANFDKVPVRVPVGEKITKIAARVLGTGAGGNVVIRLYRNNGDGSARSVLATLTITTPPASWARYEVALGAEEEVADSVSYFMQADIPTTGQKVSLLGVETYR